MTLVADLDLPEFDPNDPTLSGERWHEAIAELRAQGSWLARAPLGVIVLDRAAGEQFLRTRSAVFPGLLLAEIFGIESGPLHEQMTRNIINVNGGDHSRLRSLVNPALSPRAVERYRPAMREILEDLWTGIAIGEPIEFVAEVAKPYPSRVIARVMGALDEDAPRLHDWSMWIQRQFDPIALSDPDARATIDAKVAEFYSWVRPLIARRRGTPTDDLISSLITAEEQDDRLSDVELENLVLNILVGGVDTTQSQLAHAIRLLAANPEQWAALRADPDGLAPRAAEEALRYEPITPLTARMMVEPLEVDGIVPGEHGGDRVLVRGQPRPGVVHPARAVRHHRGAGDEADADLRSGRALLRGREPGACGARGGAGLPRAAGGAVGARGRAGPAERQRDLRSGLTARSALHVIGARVRPHANLLRRLAREDRPGRPPA